MSLHRCACPAEMKLLMHTGGVLACRGCQWTSTLGPVDMESFQCKLGDFNPGFFRWCRCCSALTLRSAVTRHHVCTHMRCAEQTKG